MQVPFASLALSATLLAIPLAKGASSERPGPALEVLRSAEAPSEDASPAPVRVSLLQGPPEGGLPGASIPFPPPSASPVGGRPAPRALCEAQIHGAAGLRAVLRSRLGLGAEQREAWKRFDEAAEAASAPSRALCAELPSAAVEPPDLLTREAFTERLLAARLEEMRAVREPLRALYAALSPEQRRQLDKLPGQE